jgi:tetratricopeptide (TPR) repeat protein
MRAAAVAPFLLAFAAVSMVEAANAEQRSDKLEECKGAAPGQAIAACTSLIETGNYSGCVLAAIYARRGMMHNLLSQFHLAITDFNLALEANGADPKYYTRRGVAYQSLGQTNKAMRDFDEAIARDPNFVAAHRYKAGALARAKPSNRLQELNLPIDQDC